MEGPDAFRVNVYTSNVVARIRKAGCRHRAHVARSDYCNLYAKLNLRCIRHTAGPNRRIPQPVYANRPVRKWRPQRYALEWMDKLTGVRPFRAIPGESLNPKTMALRIAGPLRQPLPQLIIDTVRSSAPPTQPKP